MIVLDLLIVASALVIALVAIYQSLASLGPARRLRRVRSRRVADVAEGAVEVAGKIRAVGEPLRSVAGEAAVLTELRVNYSYRSSSNKGYQSWLPEPVVRVVEAELVDETGRCPLALDHVVPIGPEGSWTFTPAAFASAYPDLWDLILGQERNIIEVRVVERHVAHDALGFASGQASPDESLVAGGDYRGVKQRLRIGGSEQTPMVLSGWSEALAQRVLLRPSILLFLHGILALAVAVGYWLARSAILAL